MQIDCTKTPFSAYGSYLALRLADDGHTLLIRDVHDTFGDQGQAFALSLELDGQPVRCEVEATPWSVTVRAAAGTARVALYGDWGLVVESEGIDLYLRGILGAFGFGYQENAQRFRFHLAVRRSVATVDAVEGTATAAIRWEAIEGRLVCTEAGVRVAAGRGRGRMILGLSSYATADPAPRVDVEESAGARRLEWETFLSRLPAVPSGRRAYADLAWYTLWASTVRARGHLSYDAVLMSKNWMCSVWSWDHCFNALALAKAGGGAGVEQWLLPFEQQLPTGSLPDSINDAFVNPIVVKPPIHGWCMQRLLDVHIPEEPLLAHIYRRLTAWTDWWFTSRDFDGDGVPNYIHGNDSGADNATLFDVGEPLEAPDLSAYLVLQLDALARIAGLLGDQVAQAAWTRRADRLLAEFREHLWNGGGFVGKVSGSHTFDPHPTSILVVLPLVLGERLDRAAFELLAARLERDFLTPFGPASEALTSPKFVAIGGYGMRGPIWAPYVYLLADGLRRGGRRDLAVRMAEGFCGAVERSGSMWEDYDALTGAGRDDPAYTWTASVYLLLLNEYLL